MGPGAQCPWARRCRFCCCHCRHPRFCCCSGRQRQLFVSVEQLQQCFNNNKKYNKTYWRARGRNAPGPVVVVFAAAVATTRGSVAVTGDSDGEWVMGGGQQVMVSGGGGGDIS